MKKNNIAAALLISTMVLTPLMNTGMATAHAAEKDQVTTKADLIEVTPEKVVLDKKNKKYTIPDVVGVGYKINDKDAAPGTYDLKDNTKDVITAYAKEGYKLKSGSVVKWTFTNTDAGADETGTGENGGGTGAGETGTGENQAKSLLNIELDKDFNGKEFTYSANDFYSKLIFNYISFNKDSGNKEPVKLTYKVDQTYEDGSEANAFYVTANPSGEEFELKENSDELKLTLTLSTYEKDGEGKPTAPEKDQPVTVKITFFANGEEVSSESAVFVNGDKVEPSNQVVTPNEPTYDKEKAVYTIPTTEGVEYQVNGDEIQPGNYNLGLNESVTIKAVATEGYTLAENVPTEWTFTHDNDGVDRQLKEIAAPTYDAEKGTFTIPESENYTYQIDGEVYEAGEYTLNKGQTVTIKAIPDEGFFIGDGVQSEWTFTNENESDKTPKGGDPGGNPGQNTYSQTGIGAAGLATMAGGGTILGTVLSMFRKTFKK